MKLPENLQLLPGVRQDGRGKLYQLARYPSGKTIQVPYVAQGAEPARMIPLPAEPQRPMLRARKTNTAERAKRVAYVEWRDVGSSTIFRDFGPGTYIEAFVNEQCRPLVRSPDCGSTWIPLERNVDYYNQWNDKEPDNG